MLRCTRFRSGSRYQTFTTLQTSQIPRIARIAFSAEIAEKPTWHHLQNRAEINDLRWRELSYAILCGLELSSLTAQDTSYSGPAPGVHSTLVCPQSLDRRTVEFPALLNCSPSLDRSVGPLPASRGQVGPCVPDRFTSVIGGLLPIALCGRTSL